MLTLSTIVAWALHRRHGRARRALEGIGEAIAQRHAAKGMMTYVATWRLDRIERLEQSDVCVLHLDHDGMLEMQVATRAWQTI
jgi:hypothetical protein